MINDPVVDQKRLISNNDEGENIPTKVPFSLCPTKTALDVGVDWSY